MENQMLFNVAIAIAGALGGWWLKVVWEAVKDLQKADKELAEKVASIEVLVAGKYITRDEFTTVVNTLFAKIDNLRDLIAKGHGK